jgi:integrase
VRKKVKSGELHWVARWTDPSTGKRRESDLTSLGCKTLEACQAWAEKRSGSMQKEQLEMAATGRRPVEPSAIDVAVAEYLDSKSRLAAETRRGIEISLKLFRDWFETPKAGGLGARPIGELEAPQLVRFKTWIVKRRKTVSATGGERGKRKSTDENLSTRSVNHHLLRVRCFLYHIEALGQLPYLRESQVKKFLANEKIDSAEPEFLHPAEVSELLRACLRHDAETFAMTREEKDGDAKVGSTPQYDPIAPFALFSLLAGCRPTEARRLRWESVHLGGRNPTIRLSHEDVSKKREARRVSLNESPSLIRLLGAMTKQRGENEFVFGADEPMTEGRAAAARKRLHSKFGAPRFTWEHLRRTCATTLYCSGVYGLELTKLAPARMGHSLATAERHYVGLMHDLPTDAKTIEAALDIEEIANEIVSRAGGVVVSGEVAARA